MEENKEVMTTEEVKTEKVVKDNKNFKNNKNRKSNKNFEPKKKLLEEKVISITRVTKVTKGGRHFRFAATMVVGDGKGLVGIGTGKSMEVPEAIKKGIQAANKNLVKVDIVDGRTIPHEVIRKEGATTVILKPAFAGCGLVAGGAARIVLELAGVKDIVSKSLGSRKKINVARATINALVSVKPIEVVALERGKTKEEILG